MTETATANDSALIIHPLPPGVDTSRADARLEEATGLAIALGLIAADAIIEPVRKLEAGTFFGKGKLETLHERIESLGVKAVIIDTALSPVQQRNLEKRWNVKVIDRTGLILEIFGERARTREGRLQVELARLTYERSRLVRTWTHLERQRGGRGFLAGPGETQIETDRRLLASKMAKLRRELEQVKRTRALHRTRRQAAPWPSIALVGYTNAGKSTLFNRLTAAGVLAKDMPFATLDPTVRGVRLPSGRRVLVSDTVGFITDLPTELIAAFRATLEEVREADILVHVRDLSDPDNEGRKADVESVLTALECGPAHGQPLVEAWNKIDRLDEEARDDALWAARTASGKSKMPVHPVSAVTGEGVAALMAAIDEALGRDDEHIVMELEPGQDEVSAWLHEHGDVVSERRDSETGAVRIEARLSGPDAGRFRARFSSLLNAHLEA
ncbi:MAG: GTPase HflX [Caulobacterales bacterium]|uniref:GTPase HflX n=1 Tax=Glycocaulis sp. TaxID=1969725 RepID=UPI003FA0CE6B